jgi:glutamyl-tRNA synthetase
VNAPFKITIKNTVPKEVTIKNHPSLQMGERKIKVNNTVFISYQDAEKLNKGIEIRLIDLYNIKISWIDKDKKEGVADYTDDIIKDNIQKIQWVSDLNSITYKIIKPNKLFIEDKFNSNSLETLEGLVESFVTTLPVDTMTQFIRIGFCRIENNESAIFTHK